MIEKQIEAIRLLNENSEVLAMMSDSVPSDYLLEAYRAFPQPARCNLQALAGLGLRLPLRNKGETIKDWSVRVRRAPFLDRYETIRRAVLSNVWVDLSARLDDLFVQEAAEALQSAPARLVSIREVIPSRRVHVVNNKSEPVFLRLVEYGPNGILEIQANFTGPCILREPIGRLARSMLASRNWRLKQGWWVVQPGGLRTESSVEPVDRHPKPMQPNAGLALADQEPLQVELDLPRPR